MKVKVLVEDQYIVTGILDGETCPAEKFLLEGDASTKAARDGLTQLLVRVAEHGTQNMSVKWSHEVNKPNGIFELVKGRLRLFYFKGVGKEIVVCCSGIMKKTQKVDLSSVQKAIKWRQEYFRSNTHGTREVIRDET